ncbi:non-classical arabinogalactan protein 30 [Euphorbia lathyris]|uniref:non-classical arabinogalactan protein 30 n=1 Tax=Euphorbia lathyris TaxID=212925 RepID=UPI00331379C0
MSKNHQKIAISFFYTLLLLQLAFADQKTEVIIEGMVYCQSCNHFGSWSLTDAKPIASSKISVICKNQWKQVNYYRGFETDSNGYFFAKLDGFKIGHSILDHPLQSCKVKLVSSPMENCKLISNVNYGINGAELRFENKVLRRGSDYEAVVYAAGPLAFRPDRCDPQTNL